MERIVISGIGCVSAAGIGYKDFGAGLLAGRTGLGRLSLFEPNGFRCSLAGEVPSLDFKGLLPGVDLRAADRSTTLALLASKFALDHSGLDLDGIDRSRVAVVVGTAENSFDPVAQFYQEIFENGPCHVNPITFANTPINVPTARIAMNFKLNGPNTTISNGQTSSLKALSYACDMIRLGQADIAIAGGVESISKEKYLAYHKTKALSGLRRSPVERCAPFDAGRNGLVLGEGAAMFVLQSEDRARATGAPLLVEICGFGIGWHKQSPDNGGAPAIAIENALEEARLDPCAVDLILAHANGSILGDKLEARALGSVFGRDCPELAVSSIKGATGELRGASGALQAAAAAIAIGGNRIPPTLNFETPDRALPACQIASRSVEKRIDTVVINSVEPLADSSALVLKRCEASNGH